MVLDKPLDNANTDGTFVPGLGGGPLQHSALGDGSFRSGLKPWQKLRPSIEILCNNQVTRNVLEKLQASYLLRHLHTGTLAIQMNTTTNCV